MLHANENESDEAFARRLAAQEMGTILTRIPQDHQADILPLLGLSNSHSSQSMNSASSYGDNFSSSGNHNNSTLLFTRFRHQQTNVQDSDQDSEHDHVLPHQNLEQMQQQQQRINEYYQPKLELCATLTFSVPQIIAALVILTQDWDGTAASGCDTSHIEHWVAWSAISAARMFVYGLVVIYTVYYKDWLEEHPLQKQKYTQIKNIIEGFALIWFVVGNMWLWNTDDNGTSTCEHPGRSPVYILASTMLIINYVQICLPCILFILIIPFFCFCRPCVIRLIARMHGREIPGQRGADNQTINSLELVTITNEHLESHFGSKTSCPICLSDLIVGEEARVLRCKHLFHKDCLDEWLRVNASCTSYCKPLHTPTVV
eukprot:GSChrysophyteH1.ASY1.ANO1.651.1 assembled CDS